MASSGELVTEVCVNNGSDKWLISWRHEAIAEPMLAYHGWFSLEISFMGNAQDIHM